MNCQEVGAILTDLARNEALTIEIRDVALAHLNECRGCSQRLNDEKLLTRGLIALAASSAEEQAHPRVEAKLREAFRQRSAPAPAPVRTNRRWIKIAAAGSIAAGIVLLRLVTPAPKVAKVAPPPPPVAIASSSAKPPAVDSAVKSPSAARRAPRPARQRVAARREEVTEFLPVAVEDGWTPLDGGRLVRVSLPRSALGMFGLPVNEEAAPERVQADVMLSHDGALRAIRFVR